MTKLQVRQIFPLFLIILDDSRMTEHMHFFLFFDQFSLHDHKYSIWFWNFIYNTSHSPFFLISLASSVLLTSHWVECCYIFILRSFRGLTCAKFKLLCQMWICRLCTSKVYPTLCDFILCCLQCLTLWDFIVNSKNWRGPQFRNLARKAEMSFFGCTG